MELYGGFVGFEVVDDGIAQGFFSRIHDPVLPPYQEIVAVDTGDKGVVVNLILMGNTGLGDKCNSGASADHALGGGDAVGLADRLGVKVILSE